jgi:hypothetical protein
MPSCTAVNQAKLIENRKPVQFTATLSKFLTLTFAGVVNFSRVFGTQTTPNLINRNRAGG